MPEDTDKEKHEQDYLLLDRFTNAASLILLNEKTSFKSFERMKGNFLEQIIEGKHPKSEIVSLKLLSDNTCKVISY
ncbi:hypothetical protein [Bacillus sp. OTU2372]|uniref:hypothetical protein n=1 Tax=Bacillus sp. OTU2372 TaxID=3043858 RepID=UPI00313E0750